MANLVLAVGVPHGPRLPRRVAQAPGQHRAEQLMFEVRHYVEQSAPDVVIVIASDHFTNFFYDSLPTYCIGLMEEAEGPVETVCVMPHAVIKGHVPLGKALLNYCLKSNFDVSASQELHMDHSVLVPLHFLTPSYHIPVVPLFINALAPPLPSARRCYALGRMLRRFLDQYDGDQRVALVASGVISGEVGGPRMGWIDEDWVETVSTLLEQGKYQSLVRGATPERLAAAGNISGELLTWITLTGAVGDSKPVYVKRDEGSGYAVWTLE